MFSSFRTSSLIRSICSAHENLGRSGGGHQALKAALILARVDVSVGVRVSNQSDASLLEMMWLAKWDVFSASVQESGSICWNSVNHIVGFSSSPKNISVVGGFSDMVRLEEGAARGGGAGGWRL